MPLKAFESLRATLQLLTARAHGVSGVQNKHEHVWRIHHLATREIKAQFTSLSLSAKIKFRPSNTSFKL